MTIFSAKLCTIIGSVVCYATLQGAVEFSPGTVNPTDIQIVPVDPTPSANDISMRIQYPKKGETEKKQPVHVEMRLDWFPLGVVSDLPRKNEIYDDNKGQSIHVFIDDKDYFEINEALFDAVDDHDEFFDQTAELDIPFPLSPGGHITRAFPCRSFGESIKLPKSFVSSFFYMTNTSSLPADLSKPYLTYNEPQGTYTDSTKPILLDFYICNCTLSKDGYKIRVTIDDSNQRFLYDWTPYYIYGLGKGTHTIQLELFSPQNTAVPGLFNNVKKQITIE
jgi:hypothetical protein